MITACLFAKPDYVSRDGTIPIYLQLTIHRKVKRILLPYRVKPNEWDQNKREVRHVNALCSKLNLVLGRELIRAQEIILDHQIKGRPLTYELFYNDFMGVDNADYYLLVEDYLRDHKGRISFGYHVRVKSVTGKLRKWRPALQVHDIDYAFLQGYQRHLIVDRKNSKNTVHSNLKIMRRVLNEAIRKKLIKENPFSSFKMETVRIERDFLTVAELQKYEDLMHRPLPYYLHKTLCWFLLACYTGRRFQDLVHFNEWHFNAEYIRIVSQKKTTNRDERKTVTIYMNDRIRNICETIKANGYQSTSNAKANKYLKELNGMLGIFKNITFHCARHTFNHVNKCLEADLALRRDLLGHDNIKSTMIYDHVDAEMMRKQMLKWNTLSRV